MHLYLFWYTYTVMNLYLIWICVVSKLYPIPSPLIAFRLVVVADHVPPNSSILTLNVTVLTLMFIRCVGMQYMYSFINLCVTIKRSCLFALCQCKYAYCGVLSSSAEQENVKQYGPRKIWSLQCHWVYVWCIVSMFHSLWCGGLFSPVHMHICIVFSGRVIVTEPNQTLKMMWLRIGVPFSVWKHQGFKPNGNN